MRRRPAGALWATAAFRRLWSAAAISAAGDQVTKLALPIIAIDRLGAGPFEVGLLLTFEQLPQLLFTLVAGAWIDRVPRKPVIFISDLGRAAVLLAIPLFAWLDLISMPLLICLGFLAGVFTTWHMIAWQSLVPSIASGDQMISGVSSITQIEALAEVGGPAIGGSLIGAIGAPAAVVLDALSFAGSATLISGIEVHEQVQASERTPLLQEIRDGFRYLLAHPVLRAIALSGCLGVLFYSTREPILRVFLLEEIDLSPGRYGLVFTVSAIGYAIGTLLPGPVSRRIGIGNAIVWPHLGLLLPGIGLALSVGAGSSAPLLIAAFLFIDGLIEPINNVNQLALRLTLMPRDMRGRLTSITRFMIRGAYPIGAMTGGLIGEHLGIGTAIWISAVAGPVGAIVYWRSGILRYRTLPEIAAE